MGDFFFPVFGVYLFIVSVEINSEVSLADIKAEIESRIAAYLKSIVMETPDSEEVVIRTSAVGAIIAGIDNVVDYSNLTINAGDANITVNNNVPVTGRFMLNLYNRYYQNNYEELITCYPLYFTGEFMK